MAAWVGSGLCIGAVLSGCGTPAPAPASGGAAIVATPTSPAGGSVTAASPTPPAGDLLLAGDPSVMACQLVPKADLEMLLGETFSDGVPGPGNCKIYSDDGSGGVVYISVGDWTTFKAAAQANHPAPLAGLGDEALRTPENALYTRVGLRGIFVQFTATIEKDPVQLLAKGRSVADRLVGHFRGGSSPSASAASPTP